MLDFEDDDETSSASDEVDEVTAYLQTRSPPEVSILSWWKDEAGRLPKLSTLARQLLAIPATSAASERSFSAAGCTVSARRTALAPETVDNIMFIHSNNVHG